MVEIQTQASYFLLIWNYLIFYIIIQLKWERYKKIRLKRDTFKENSEK